MQSGEEGWSDRHLLDNTESDLGQTGHSRMNCCRSKGHSYRSTGSWSGFPPAAIEETFDAYQLPSPEYLTTNVNCLIIQTGLKPDPGLHRDVNTPDPGLHRDVTPRRRRRSHDPGRDRQGAWAVPRTRSAPGGGTEGADSFRFGFPAPCAAEALRARRWRLEPRRGSGGQGVVR
uniref:Uncharacterized protein n=1 Tax=Rangifer tarandus platyrhynchus TaxID=3082113 RepID=A0ACB0FL20_RANTA|nr:unnamed protein product [Rangifer tarandus platyrhynchus]